MPGFTKGALMVGSLVGQLLLIAQPVHSAETRNLTGLPAYPNLNAAVMDEVFRTDKFGH
jgi:hypothetical protein